MSGGPRLTWGGPGPLAQDLSASYGQFPACRAPDPRTVSLARAHAREGILSCPRVSLRATPVYKGPAP